MIDLQAGTVSGNGADTLRAIENAAESRGSDTLIGDRRTNALDGDEGNDIVRGGGGGDLLTSTGIRDDPGHDQLFGEAGDDTINAHNNNPGDAVDGGDDTDACTLDEGDTAVACESVTVLPPG